MKSKKIEYLCLSLTIIFVLISPIKILFNNPGLPEFDPLYYYALSDKIIAEQKIGLTDPLNIRIEGSVYTLPAYPLLLSILTLMMKTDSVFSIKFLHIAFLTGSLLLLYLIGRLIYSSKLAIIPIILLFGATPFTSRIILPLRELANIFLFLLIIYLILLFKKKAIQPITFYILYLYLLFFSLFLYQIFTLIFILSYFLLVVDFKNYLNSKKIIIILTILISIILLYIFSPLGYIIERSFIFYITNISGLKTISLSELINRFRYLIFTLTIFSLISFFSIKEIKLKKIYAGLILLSFIFFAMLFLKNELSTRAYLYLSILFCLIIPLFFHEQKDKKMKIIIISLIIILTITTIKFPNYKVWINENEKFACEWADKNLPSKSIILTQRSMGYLIMPYCKRPVFSRDIYLSEKTKLDNIDKFILNISKSLEKNFGSDQYLFISINKTKTKKDDYYKNRFLHGLNLSKFDNPYFTEIYKNEDVVIFKINFNETNFNKQ